MPKKSRRATGVTVKQNRDGSIVMRSYGPNAPDLRDVMPGLFRSPKSVPDRHGEWDVCHRCGCTGQISRAVAFGGFLSIQPNGLIVCWNGRECSLRLRRRRARPEGL
jgi:hypothetical protein